MNRLIFSFIFSFTYVLIFGQTSQICGKVGDPTGNCPGFAGVTVTITNEDGDVLCETTTGVGGNYCCTISNSDFPVKICPKVKCPYDQGVSTLDLVLIQKFILGLPNPASMDGQWPPYFRLWADVNGDGKVTASDLTLLRKFILGIVMPETICRIVSEKCKLQFGGVPYSYYLCLNGCEFVEGPNSGNVNFELFHIGDVNNSIVDSDCTKPLHNSEGEESFKIPNKFGLVYRDNLDKSTSIGFASNQRISFLNLSIKIGNLSNDDLIFPIKNAEYIIKDGILHISYFSDDQNQAIDVKDVLKIKQGIDKRQFLLIDGLFMIFNGELFGIEGNSISKTSMRNTSANATLTENAGNLTIILDDNLIFDDNSNLYIYNSGGELVFNTSILAKSIEKRIDIGNFNYPNGIYILKIQNSNGEPLLSKKFVIFK